MKHAAIGVALVVMGTGLMALPIIFQMVMASQEAYVLAHSDSNVIERPELSGLATASCVGGGIVMILLAVWCARGTRRD